MPTTAWTREPRKELSSRPDCASSSPTKPSTFAPIDSIRPFSVVFQRLRSGENRPAFRWRGAPSGSRATNQTCEGPVGPPDWLPRLSLNQKPILSPPKAPAAKISAL